MVSISCWCPSRKAARCPAPEDAFANPLWPLSSGGKGLRGTPARGLPRPSCPAGPGGEQPAEGPGPARLICPLASGSAAQKRRQRQQRATERRAPSGRVSEGAGLQVPSCTAAGAGPARPRSVTATSPGSEEGRRRRHRRRSPRSPRAREAGRQAGREGARRSLPQVLQGHSDLFSRRRCKRMAEGVQMQREVMLENCKPVAPLDSASTKDLAACDLEEEEEGEQKQGEANGAMEEDMYVGEPPGEREAALTDPPAQDEPGKGASPNSSSPGSTLGLNVWGKREKPFLRSEPPTLWGPQPPPQVP
ncbi:uncharacterized protein LOC132592829 [Zootoca vivipara]|uniref:uncharacterized protein LOC132592829 n=1 Tax=Zootoca vivipara TaxID=8524 RepID=UPI00293B947D|nr:uncharacterized protein LOC132592829 [Zootoca vivipara]